MEILLFRTFYQADSSAFPMEFSALASYIWLQQVFFALYMTWFWETDIFESIRNGDIAYELCKPIDIYHLWFTRRIAIRLSKAVLLTFYTINEMGIRMVSQSLVEFLSGAIIPIPFLPNTIREFVEILPFASMKNAPLRIYSGGISISICNWS